MKAIDIMQKVANKEIFKFKIDDVNYYVDKLNYICEENGTRVEWYIDDEWLNMNAEIIDEKIEYIECYFKNGEHYIEDSCFRVQPLEDLELNQNEIVIIDKINEIIRKINKLETK